ncbi:MAG TPA: hypothetical protein EYN34_03710 [Aquifex sp.]|nr:hypothetical protein [Aquifex sp.]
MNLKKGLAIGLFSLAGLVGLASADDYTDLVKLLEAKGVFTHEEAQKLIKLHEEHLAKSKTSEGGEGLTSSDWKRLKALAELKISGKAYIHYDYTSDAPNASDREKGAFKVNRAYFEVRKYFDKSGKNYFRLTADVYTSSDGSNAFRLKYAYLNWEINPLLQTEIGLVHRPWIDWEEHHAWFHRFVDKTFIEDADGAHLVVSADYGIAFKGNYKKASYMFGVYNGEGYHGTEDDKHFGKAVAARVAYDFTQNLFGALHVAYISNNNDGETDTALIHPLVGYKNRYFLVAAQYIWDREDPESGSVYTNNGFAINGDLYLKPLTGKPVTLFGRYGRWNFDSSVESSTDYTKADRWQLLAGVQYDWNRHVKTALAFKHVHYDISSANTQTGKNNKDTLMAAMEVNW